MGGYLIIKILRPARRFLAEFKLLLLRAKKKYFPRIEQWLQDIAEPP
jgi:tRNA A22 N-methylase